MELLHSLPYTKDGKTVPVGTILIPNSLVSTVKASLLAGLNPVEFRLSPKLVTSDCMKVNLRAFDVVGVAVYKDGDEKLVRLHRE